MSTRALVHLSDEEGIFTTVYHHFDGYPSGLGNKLRDILGATTIVNGISSGQQLPFFANGMECAAAYLVEQLKNSQIGRVLIVRAGVEDMWQDYTYTLSGAVGQQIKCVCRGPGDVLVYDGLLSMFHDTRSEEVE